MTCQDAHLGMRRLESLAMWAVYKYTDMVHERNKLGTPGYSEYNHGVATGRSSEAITTLAGCLTGLSHGDILLQIVRVDRDVKGLPTDKAKAFAAWVTDKSNYVGSCF